MDKFTIVIPVYNEAKNLKILIPKIYRELKNRKFEIIVVDDNSTDMTSQILKKFKKKNFCHLIRKNDRDLSKSSDLLGFMLSSIHSTNTCPIPSSIDSLAIFTKSSLNLGRL